MKSKQNTKFQKNNGIARSPRTRHLMLSIKTQLYLNTIDIIYQDSILSFLCKTFTH